MSVLPQEFLCIIYGNKLQARSELSIIGYDEDKYICMRRKSRVRSDFSKTGRECLRLEAFLLLWITISLWSRHLDLASASKGVPDV
jgi:hypothetical protein